MSRCLTDIDFYGSWLSYELERCLLWILGPLLAGRKTNFFPQVMQFKLIQQCGKPTITSNLKPGFRLLWQLAQLWGDACYEFLVFRSCNL